MKNAAVVPFLLSCFVLVGGARPGLSASWPNGGVPITPEATDQSTAVAAGFGDGSSVVVWAEMRQNGFEGIYAQRLDPRGKRLWGASGVAVFDLPMRSIDPAVVTIGADVVIAWESEGRVRVQRLNSRGEPQWQDQGMPVAPQGVAQALPALASNGADDVVVTWCDWRNGSSDIYAQRFGPDGSRIWEDGGVPVCGKPGNQSSPQVVPDGAGGAFFAWEDRRDRADFTVDIYVQRLNQNGASLWAWSGIPVSQAPSDRLWLTLAADGLGGAIVAWSDRPDWNAPYELRVQRISAEGRALWLGGVHMATDVPELQAMHGDANGGVILAWIGGIDQRLYAQKIGADGSAQWKPEGGVLVGLSANSQMAPRLAPADDGAWFVMWAEVDREVPRTYAQLLSDAGERIWNERGVALGVPHRGQAPVNLASTGTGSAIAVWNEVRDQRGVLVATRLDSHSSEVTVSPGLGRMLEIRSVRPNPARGAFLVNYSTRSGGAASLELLDVAGRRVFRRQLPEGIEGSEVIDANEVGALPAGIYHLRIVQGALARHQRIHLLR